MKLKDIAENLKLEAIGGFDENREVYGAYIGDLLSVVMANGKENNIWITIQTHINIIAVAVLVNMSGIIIAEDMEIDENTVEKAKEEKVALFKSKLTSYEIACQLNNLGI
jgi:serine kinase of HPr protein (carbohydrate metabolism regulator)